MSRPAWLFKALAGAAILLAFPCRGGESSGVVQGHVLDAQGKPVKGATVEIGRPKAGWRMPVLVGDVNCLDSSRGGSCGNRARVESLHIAKTDRSGYYHLQAPEMSYEMVAVRLARNAILSPLAYGHVEIRAGQTITRDFVLHGPEEPK